MFRFAEGSGVLEGCYVRVAGCSTRTLLEQTTEGYALFHVSLTLTPKEHASLRPCSCALCAA